MARIAPKDLASAVAAAKPGDRIELDAGELIGQVVIDKPLMIEGRGAGTWLGNGTGPVLIVRSAGVELRDLHVEMTGDLEHAAILVESDHEPVRRNVMIRRGELRVVQPRLSFASPPAIRLKDHTPAAPARTVPPHSPPEARAPTQRAIPAASGAIWPRGFPRGYVLIGLALLGVIVWAASRSSMSSEQPSAPDSSSAAPAHEPSAGPAAEPALLRPDGPKPPHALVVAERAAIANGDETMLEALIAPDAFGFGTDAWEVAYSGRELAKLIARTLGTAPVGGHPMTRRFEAQVGIEGDVAWIAEDFEVSGVRIATTQLAVYRGGRWSVAAWHWGIPVPDADAFRAARDGTLPGLAQIRDVRDADGDLHAAFRAAFSSKRGFLEALGDRADVFDLGSAPSERKIGGAQIRAAYGARNFELAIPGDVAVGRVGPRAGWGAAVVEYTIWRGNTIYTVPYRVLAVLLNERAGWRIVLTQWSNGAPVPR